MTMRRVSVDEIRRRFNGGAYWEQAVAGTLTCCIVKDSKPASPDEPEGSRAYTVECYEPGKPQGVGRRFRAHCYVREDADGRFSFGGSGLRLPDPKVLIADGVKYVIDIGRRP